jgi:hypothetical protein
MSFEGQTTVPGIEIEEKINRNKFIINQLNWKWMHLLDSNRLNGAGIGADQIWLGLARLG